MLEKLDAGENITGAVFGDVVEDARKLIPLVPNANTRKTLEKVSGVVSPTMAEFTLGKIMGDYAASTVIAPGGPSLTNSNPQSTVAVAQQNTEPASTLQPSPVAGPAGIQLAAHEAAEKAQEAANKEQAELNRRKALESADAKGAAELSRQEIDAKGISFILDDSEKTGLQTFESYFPPEATIFEMVHTQTKRFEQEIHSVRVSAR